MLTPFPVHLSFRSTFSSRSLNAALMLSSNLGPCKRNASRNTSSTPYAKNSLDSDLFRTDMFLIAQEACFRTFTLLG